jgi:hypothetical protein
MSVTVAEVDPIFLKNYELVIEALDYRKHVDSVALVPQTSTVTWRGGGNNTHSDTAVQGWQAQIGYMQDWKSANSFSRFLWEHQGETVQAVFNPTAGEGTSWSVDLTIVPGQIGGAVGAAANTTVTLGAGDPVPTFPTAGS